MKNFTEIKIKNLKKNDAFKFSKSQRKFRIFNKLIKLGKTVPKQFRGQSLLILDNCKQVVVDENEICLKKNS